jgi:hypothetical protein
LSSRTFESIDGVGRELRGEVDHLVKPAVVGARVRQLARRGRLSHGFAADPLHRGGVAPQRSRRRGGATHLNSASNACLPVQDACWPGILGRNAPCFDGNFRPDRDATLGHKSARWEQATPSSSEAAVERRNLPNQLPGSRSASASHSFGFLHDNLAGRGSASPSPQRMRRVNLNEEWPGKIESETTQAGQHFDSCDATADIPRVRTCWSSAIAGVPWGAPSRRSERRRRKMWRKAPNTRLLAPILVWPDHRNRLRETDIGRSGGR